MDWNRRLKIIAAALSLNRQEVARAATLGGTPTTNSAANAWLSGAGATKTGVRGQTLHRHRSMTEQEFDAFLLGMQAILDESDTSGPE